ncbi:hypothetical protein [Mucilaginibacter sp.]|uniref:hypothetical protein n=1 Tax=Mucilaginibacter sp. TaxID=1882438 RepID=UPI00284C4AAD|nr:hypothetical protein [Mucilaginibacter sp.]MDR3694740.1 hypothetical protein [Mucilaginibacter sp.]
MKIRPVLFLIIAFGAACRYFPADLKENPSQMRKITDTLNINYNNLTALDKQKYDLNVKVESEGDDSCSGPVKHFFVLTAILQNKSNDTLKYMDWTCSHMIWCTDSKLVWANEQESYCIACDSNFPAGFQVLPHQSKRIALMAGFRANVKPVTTQFRVGIILERILKPSDFSFYLEKFDSAKMDILSYQTQNLIWSNVIQVRN